MVLSGYLVYATFTKKFTDYDRVKVETSNIGLQLPARADVKIRGVLVGEVLDMSATSDGAELTLGLFPSQIDTIPDNVTASIVPKTLFGEKYVSLIVPDEASASPIKAGDTIERTVVVHRGREGALRPLPAAAHGRAGRAQRRRSTRWPPRSRAAATRSARTSRPSTATSSGSTRRSRPWSRTSG